jgi:hypothetical protein
VSRTVDSIATPLVRGVLGALSSLGIALAVVVVPALAAQVAGTASSATALDAILIGLSVLVLGHGGGVMVSTGVIDGPVTVTPFGLLLLLVMLSALSMRRVGRALRPVREDGMLRVGALRDVGSALGMYALVYAIGLAVLAGIGRSADASPMVTSAVVSGVMVAVIGGLVGLLWSLRREPTASVPGVRVLELLPAPYGDVARAVLLALSGLLGAGMAAVVMLLLASVPAQSALFDGLAPGIVGGIVLTLLQLALLPLVAVWALTVLLGGTVGVGTATGISLAGAETGVLPALPLLGALPEPGDFPAAAWVLMLVPAAAVALGAVRLVHDVDGLPRRDRVTAWIAYPVAVILACLLLAGLSTGGIGDGRLVHLGPQMSTLALPLIGLVAVTTALVLGVLATPLIPWTRTTVQSLRERVEAAERTEQGEAQAEAERRTPHRTEQGEAQEEAESETPHWTARTAARGGAPVILGEPVGGSPAVGVTASAESADEAPASAESASEEPTDAAPGEEVEPLAPVDAGAAEGADEPAGTDDAADTDEPAGTADDEAPEVDAWALTADQDPNGEEPGVAAPREEEAAEESADEQEPEAEAPSAEQEAEGPAGQDPADDSRRTSGISRRTDR